MMENDTDKQFNASIIDVQVLDEESLVNELKNYSNCVYLFLSSKDLSKARNGLMSLKFDIK
jgi:hypothetical protein